jgi:hypothetical protein
MVARRKPIPNFAFEADAGDSALFPVVSWRRGSKAALGSYRNDLGYFEHV